MEPNLGPRSRDEFRSHTPENSAESLFEQLARERGSHDDFEVSFRDAHTCLSVEIAFDRLLARALRQKVT